MTQKHWYAVMTKPRQEARADEHLRNQGFDCFLPKMKRVKNARGKFVERIEPMFPRYLFLNLAMGEESIATLRSTRGVTGLVKFGHKIPAMPETFMQGVLNLADRVTGLVTPRMKKKQKGDEVIVTDGPFAGLKAIFEAETAENRVLLLLEMLGTQTRIRVPEAFVSAA